VDWAMAGPATSNASRPRNAIVERMIFLPLPQFMFLSP
jgi:hypothetical protein